MSWDSTVHYSKGMFQDSTVHCGHRYAHGMLQLVGIGRQQCIVYIMYKRKVTKSSNYFGKQLYFYFTSV